MTNPANDRRTVADRWANTIVGILLTGAIGLGSWTANGLLALRDQQIRDTARIESQANDLARIEGALRAMPVRAEIDALRSDIGGLRVELREVREDLRRRH